MFFYVSKNSKLYGRYLVVFLEKRGFFVPRPQGFLTPRSDSIKNLFVSLNYELFQIELTILSVARSNANT